MPSLPCFCVFALPVCGFLGWDLLCFASNMINKASFLLLSALLICCGAEDTVSVGNIMGDCQPLGTRCFKFVSTARSWAESERHCVAMGGNLASVHSIDEYSFIQDMIRKQTYRNLRTWIGGYDAVKEGLWFWSDGSRFNFITWSPGNPDNYLGKEHCIQMNHGGSRLWNDSPCQLACPSVCAVQSV
ncbi:galactose-specific lectin nattectin-like isoform X1 [Clupea harengus]|uniref:Galactose-specific lectin nattectin-like isoform X1 n=2 Tax=Clupea harengus TaxID=7950 RepID=A0A6P8EMC7_CLUHA|nr:galactose-specific lectin nattectin-like isoform X1 [Clupea harengus]